MPRTGLESEEAYWDDLASRLREVLDRFRAPMSAEAEVKYLGYIVEWLESTEAHYQGADDSLYGCDPGGLSYVAIERSTADVKTASRSDRNRVSFEPEHIRRARHALMAEIMLFGRSLIEAGKQALPVEATMAAHTAKRATKLGQFWDAAKDARYAMDFDRWAKRHPLLRTVEDEQGAAFEAGGERHEMSATMVLPHIFGRYPDSPMRPNCLGAAILAASWCDLAGIENFVYASLVQSDEEYHWTRLSQIWRRIFSFLEARGFEFDQEVDLHLREDIETAEQIARDEVLHASLDPHACVVFSYSAGRWMVMDNWLHKRYHLGSSNDDTPAGVYNPTMDDVVDSLNDFSPEPGLTIGRRAWGLDSDWRLLEHQLDDAFVLTEALMGAYASYDPASGTDSLEAYLWHLIKAMRAVEYHGSFFDWKLDEAMVSTERIAKSDPQGWAMYGMMIHHTAYRYGFVENIAEEDLPAFVDSLYVSYQHDTETAERMRRDLVLMPLREAMAQVSMHHRVLSSYKKSKPISAQPVLEFGRATIQFGCAALAHLIAWDDWTGARLRLADLLHFTTSQAIAYDAITELHHEAEESDITEPYVLSEELMPAQADTLSFARWLMQAGRDPDNLLAFPGDVDLTGPQAAAVLRAWEYLQNMPQSLRHRQATQLLNRIQQASTRQPTGGQILITRERIAHGA